MTNNVIVSYDLHDPGQNYDTVTDAVKSLGSWAKIHYSVFYVSTSKTLDEAYSVVSDAADANDSVFLVDASNNSATWRGLSDKASKHIQKKWND